MSALPSEARYSTYSDPSTTSSRTLHSRGSETYVDNGESSSQRHARGAAEKSRNSQSHDSDHSLVEERIQEQDFARRRQRVRRSGGFLLDSQFPGASRSRHGHQRTITEDTKGKRSTRTDEGFQGDSGNGQVRKDVSSLASTAARDDRRRYAQPTREDMQDNPNGDLHVGKTRAEAHEKQSPPRVRVSSPVPMQQQSIDPNQLINMALNLSESRRRNIAAGSLIAPQARSASGTWKEGSFGNTAAGGSLRKYLNEQRRTSRNISPGGSGSPSRHVSTSMQRSASLANPNRFTPATLARRDKARSYIELRMEYIRLLDYLPPLKTDASAPGNFFVSSNNVPGSPQAQLTRVPSYAGKQHNLGRPYNPLQYIRNKRSRARERRPLGHGSDEFTDIDTVRDWVDLVEQHSKHPGFRRDKGVSLPKLHADHPQESAPDQTSRPHKGWLFSAEELFADAYWLEQDDNKTIIENRHGRRLFPPAEAQRPDLLGPRTSKESVHQRRRSWIDDVSGITEDPAAGEDSDKGSDRGRKRRLLPPFRADTDRPGKHSRRGSRLRANLDSDNSDADDGPKKGKPRVVVDGENNTGPLALQIESILKREALEVPAKSPAMVTPDTPNKWGRDQVEVPETKISHDSLDVPRFSNGSASMIHKGPLKMPPRARTDPTPKFDENEVRSSFEDLDSTAPTTPILTKQFPHIGSDLSPPPSRGASLTQKPRRSKLNPFHTHEQDQETKRAQYPESVSADPGKERSSRQPSEETSDTAHIGHTILTHQAVKSLLGHRKNASTTSLPSPDKIRRRETQEPPSAVSRFFKGVKNEGSKVSGFVFRRDRPDDEDTDELSDRHFSEDDTDTSAKGAKTKRPTLSRSVTTTTVGSAAVTEDGRYHLELPTFRPAHEATLPGDSTPPLGDHITRQNQERKSDRSPRFDRLAPPKMDLERISSASSVISLEYTQSHSQERINEALSRPGRFAAKGLPPTALRQPQDLEDRQRSSSRPTLEGKRHWSIADDHTNKSLPKVKRDSVTKADIARVEALLLCSGVKAKQISHNAYTPRVPPPKFLARAATTARYELIPVPRKEEHVLAARILMSELESSTRLLNNTTKKFKANTLNELTDLITTLRTRLDDDLMPRILDSGDKAVRITSEISGQGPLQVKQINDDIDRMLRARRRRMRWIRSFGWMMVEWALVAVMWWLWLIVVLVGSVKKIFGFGFGVVRWLLWL